MIAGAVFLRCFLVLLSAVFCASGQSQYRAFWADAFHPGFKTPQEVDALVDHLVQAKANAIFMQARRRGDSYYRQSLEPMAPDAAVPAAFDPLAYLIEKAHARNIEVHAWFVVYPAWRNEPPHPDPNHVWNRHGSHREGRENWANYSSTGVPGFALDPGHPDVLPYLMDVFLEPVRRYDIDGVHLDYVRYPEDADYGYNPAAVDRFHRLETRVGQPSRTDTAWSEFRRKQVTDLVRQLYLNLQILRPKVKLSMAAITWGDGPRSDAEFRSKDAYSRVFQDWRGWLEEGIIDMAIPMNYFRDATNAGFLDRWTEYQKDRQYGRAIVNGLGNYLNTIPQTVSQVGRVLAPSAAGNSLLGVCFYSYSATASGIPERPNPEFYATIGGLFPEFVPAPELPWKVRPEKGSIAGRIEMSGDVLEWWKDGANIRLSSEDGAFIRNLRTDVTGFFGAVELAPGRYRAEWIRDGLTIAAVGPLQVEPGRVAEFRLRASAEQIDAAMPALQHPGRAAAPGDVLRLYGRNLALAYGAATAVPLPAMMGGTLVLVNGVPAPLFEIDRDFVEIQLPFQRAGSWDILVRRAGADSNTITLESVAAAPAILSARRSGGDGIEIIATGLGMTDPPVPAGTGVSADEPYFRTAESVKLILTAGGSEWEIAPLFSGLMPYYPGRYVVRAQLPEGVSAGEVRLRVAGQDSPSAVF